MSPLSGPPSPPMVLVVEDSDEDFDTCRDAARRANLPHLIHRVGSGDECLEYLGGVRTGAARPVLILLDLNTPGIDGRETLATLKGDPVLRTIPVVVLTTSNNPRDAGFCYRAGANAYHVKPVRHTEHLRVLDAVFGYWLNDVVLPGEGGPGS